MPQTQPIKKTIDVRREQKQCPECKQRFSRDAQFCPFDGARLEAADFDPLGDPLVGSTIDSRYQVLEILGEGGMGRVYKARHTALERFFAMKVLRRDLARDEQLAERFIHEAKATASIRHPNVVQITDFGKMPDGTPYFVMELLVGDTLGAVIKAGGPVPAARAVRIIKQVAAALGAAHAASIVHRDMKPDNVFLVGGVAGGVASDDVRVVDFGAAKIIGASRLTRQGIVFGTPHYMSPEQASGAPVDHRADIYALGIIMYEMFTGRVPFEADTYMGVLTQHMFVQPVPPSQVCAAARELGALEDITLTCLAKKPEERYGAMEDLTRAIDGVVRTRDDGGADIAPSGERPSRWGKEPRARLADELEPPTLDEMRLAIDSALPPKRALLPWGWIIGVAAVLLSAAVAWALVRPTSPDSSASVSVPVPAPVPESAVIPIPPPPPVASASASASAPAAASSPAPPAPARPVVRRPPAPPAGIDDVGDPFASKRH